MDKYLTINSYLKKNNNKQSPSIPKLKINPSYNITIYHNKIYPNRNYDKMENKIINTELSSKFNNYMLLNRRTSDSPNKYLFKTIWTEANSSLKNNNNKKTLFLKTSKSKFARKTNRSEKVSMKLLNDFFKPEYTQTNKSIFTPTKFKKINKTYNCSTENKKEKHQNNYLYFYFPNLFNNPNNRIVDPKLNSSKFLVAPLPALSFNEEVKNLKVCKVNTKTNENGKSMYSSIISSKKDNDQNNPVFIEKLYNIDVLKNLRFGFKNPVEKSKFRNLIKSFYTAKNLKYILPKKF